MMRVLAAALALALSLPAGAQEELRPPPPPPPEEPPSEPARQSEVGYFESCFGVPHPGMGPFAIGVEAPIPLGPIDPGGGAPSVPASSVSSSDEKAWLIFAVVAVAALPVVVYAFDGPAPPIALQRFACPTFSVDMVGGADSGRAGVGSGGFVTTRFGFGVSHLATEIEYSASPALVNAFATHLVVRVTPRAHVEGGLALGYRRQVLGDRAQDGFDLGLPHRYTLWREGLRTLALELRPSLLIGRQVEPMLEGALLIPLAQVLHLRLGGRVYTFDGSLLWGLSAGLGITL